MNSYEELVDFQFEIEKLIVGYDNLIQIKVVNTGNSTLCNYSFEIIKTGFAAEILNQTTNQKQGSMLKPEKEIIFLINFKTNGYSSETTNFTLGFTADIYETGNKLNSTEEFEVEVLRINQQKVLRSTITALFFIVAILAYGYSFKYIYSKYKEINQVPDSEIKQEQKSKRTGRYVKVEELKRAKHETEADKINADDEEKEGVSLDELISEEEKRENE